MQPSFVLTIDVEDYFQVAAFERQCAPKHWSNYPSRVSANTERILDLLDRHGTRATFFILGWVAEHHPDLVRRIHARGHDIASHGYNHQRLNHLSREQFRDDITRAKAMLEDLTAASVIGYRAPSFSFDEAKPWIQDELLDAGYRYSSSLNPVPHDLYGYRHAPRTPFRWSNGLLEIPVATCEWINRRIPCAGGGYFRLYPYRLTRTLLNRAAAQLKGPVTFYLHPWEVDPEQPRIQGASAKSRFRHYVNLSRTYDRLDRLLADYNWCTMQEAFSQTSPLDAVIPWIPPATPRRAC